MMQVTLEKVREEFYPLAKFKAPPVAEVVCDIQFKSQESLMRTENIIKKIYSEVMQADFPEWQTKEWLAPIGGINEDSIVARAVPSSIAPRFWFVSSDQSQLFQLQSDRFVFNWRKNRDQNGDSQEGDYPSFKSVYSIFKAKFDELNNTLQKHELGSIQIDEDILAMELTYINHIELEHSLFRRMPEKIEQLFAPLQLTHSKKLDVVGVIQNYSWRAQLELPYEAGDLRISIRNGLLRLSEESKVKGKPVIALEFRASGIPIPEIADMDTWFEIAHSSIVKTFVEMTDKRVQKEVWRRQDNGD